MTMKALFTFLFCICHIIYNVAQNNILSEISISNHEAINTHYSELSWLTYGDSAHIIVSDRGIKDKKGRWTKQSDFNLYLSDSNGVYNIMSPRLNSSYNDGPIAVVNEELIYITTTNRTGKIDPRTKQMVYRLNISKAEKVNGKWTVSDIPEFTDKSCSYAHPAISADGNTLYFASDRPGGKGATDIYKCNISSGSPTAIENLGDSINSKYEEQFPFYHESGYLFYSSRRKGGFGGLDIYYAKQNGIMWTAAINAGGLINTQAHESGMYLNPSMTNGHFTSNRPGGRGSDDIYLIQVKDIPIIKEEEVASELAQVESSKLIDLTELVADAIEQTKKAIESNEKPANSEEVVSNNKVEVAQDEINLLETAKEIEESVEEKKEQVTTEVMEQPSIKNEKEELPKNVNTEEIVQNEVETNSTAEKSKQDIVEEVLEVEEKTVEVIKDDEQQSTPESKEELITEVQEVSPIILPLEQKIIDKKLNNAYFSSGSHALNDEAKRLIKELSIILKEDESVIIELHAHTDAKGDFASNALLSEKRARSVMAALQQNGIPINRIRYLAYGETDLVIKTKEDARMNRRVEFKIFNPKANIGTVTFDENNSVRNNLVLEKGYYFVQVAAMNKTKIVNRFNLKEFGVPICYFDKGLYKYVLGPYASYGEAKAKLISLKRNYPGVFIYLNLE